MKKKIKKQKQKELINSEMVESGQMVLKGKFREREKPTLNHRKQTEGCWRRGG